MNKFNILNILFSLFLIFPIFGMSENTGFVSALELFRQQNNPIEEQVYSFEREIDRRIVDIYSFVKEEEYKSNRNATRTIDEYFHFDPLFKEEDLLFLYSTNEDPVNVDFIINNIRNYMRGDILNLSNLGINSAQLEVLIPYIERLVRFKGLKHLELAYNYIRCLPANFELLNGLYILNLSNNYLYYFNKGFNYPGVKYPNDSSLEVLATLKTLKILEMKNNPFLEYIPWQLSCLSNLLLLDLRENRRLKLFSKFMLHMGKINCLVL